MEENWCALAIAILLKQPPETSFQILEEGKKNQGRSALDCKDTLDMISFREQGLTYREIGEMYGLKEYVVYKRIKYYNEHIKNNRPVVAGATI